MKLALPLGYNVPVVQSEIEYVRQNGEKAADTFKPKNVALVFPYIPGQLFGTPEGKSVFIQETTQDLKFTLDLKSKLPLMDDVALRLRSNPNTYGLTLTPKTTRIARIETFAYDSITNTEIGSGGFIDADSGDALILVYVTRPCKISGDLVLNNETYSHDIKLNRPGFHWVSIKKDSHNKYLLKEHTASKGVSFQVVTTDVMKI